MLAELKLGVDWIKQLHAKLAEIDEEREAEIEKINKVLTIDPQELARLYVEPDFQPFNPANNGDDDMDDEDVSFKVRSGKWLSQFLQRGGRRDGRHVAFILSDAGMGKTSLLAMLSLSAAAKFWPDETIFRLFKLGPATKSEIENLTRPSKTVLLLDSLDEDPTAFARIEDRIEEILRITQHFKKVIITCRTQFFPDENSFEKNGGLIKIGGFTCKVIYLSLFDDSQIGDYLDKAFFGRTDQKERAQSIVPKMSSLRMRPMLLAHIEDLTDRVPGEGRWNAYRIHEALVCAWLDREERKGLVKANELLKGCWTMAVHLQTSQGEQAVSVEKLVEILLESDTPRDIRRVEDFGGRSLLNRNSEGNYRFAHYSIQEFLVVQRMVARPGEAAGFCVDLRWTDELANFLVAWMLEDPSERLRGELAKAIGWKTEWRKLQGAQLQEVDLRRANLQKASLEGTDLRGSDLRESDLQGANLQGAVLREADLRGSDLQRANLRGAVLREADLRGSDLRGADLWEADLHGAYLHGAFTSEGQLEYAKGTSMKGPRDT